MALFVRLDGWDWKANVRVLRAVWCRGLLLSLHPPLCLTALLKLCLFDEGKQRDEKSLQRAKARERKSEANLKYPALLAGKVECFIKKVCCIVRYYISTYVKHMCNNAVTYDLRSAEQTSDRFVFITKTRDPLIHPALLSRLKHI